MYILKFFFIFENFWEKLLTFACILSPVVMNSAAPFPASAIPFTRVDDAPDPIPNEKHLGKNMLKPFRLNCFLYI